MKNLSEENTILKNKLAQLYVIIDTVKTNIDTLILYSKISHMSMEK